MFGLTFAEDFFSDETFPDNTKPSHNPNNCYQALVSMMEFEPEEYKYMVYNLLPELKDLSVDDMKASHINVTLLDMIRETNLCYDLCSPVMVFIDPECEYWIEVHDK